MIRATIFLSVFLCASAVWAQPQDVDNDGDGFTPLTGDCNDSDASIYPNAPELCDSKDNDCDNVIDNPPDDDGDGLHECNGDCDDNNANVYTGNTEVCDAVDNDCDGDVNEGTGSRPFLRRTCYGGPAGTAGVGLCKSGFEECSSSSAPYWSGTCQGEVVPATEVCDGDDNDCDGTTDEGFDQDGDGVTTCDGDCDDGDADRYPGNNEICDGKDNDCSASTRDADLTRACYTGAAGTRNTGVCSDGTESCNGANGWSGTCAGQTLPSTESCNQQDDDCDGATDEDFDQDNDGSTTCGGDCDDNDPQVRPGRSESCDGKDNDCDNLVDERNAQGDPLRRSCYSGPSGTLNRGICQAGTQTCSSGSFGSCVGEVLPSTETCNGVDDDCDRRIDEDFDQDNDGVTTCEGDCDDNDSDRYPGNTEICDGIDNDCDGVIDENFDNDGDGFTTCAGDCDDTDASIFPGATESCNGVDDDCDGSVDEDFTDADGDGFVFCGPNADCDDNDPTVYPGAPEACDGVDEDCDGAVDERPNGRPLRRSCYTGPSGTAGVGLCARGRQECTAGIWGTCEDEIVPEPESCDRRDNDCDGTSDEDFDQDGDGFVTCGPAEDCDDQDSTKNPGQMEVCDGKDNDCDGNVDETPGGDPLTRPCYDGPADTEGKGICTGGVNACEGSSGYSTQCTGQTTPQMEICNELDDDCDGEIDESFDDDGDGFTECGERPDCDDTDPEVNPDALEICNNVDDDCDGIVDGNETSCYDGPVGTATVGECRAGVATCAMGMPSGICDGQVIPVDEVCDGLDNDCDGEVDEGFDQDGDGVTSCDGDCDDLNAFVSPELPERCDCTDNDCDGTLDELPFGNAGSICEFGACHDFDGDGFTNCEGDCNDLDLSAFPGASEVCGDGVDNDCDGRVDENVDEDGDGTTTCEGDCDDRFASIRPDAPEVCDGFDNNCDGRIDEGYDQDGDLATTCVGDCDDANPNRSPYLREVCGNGIDDDCDGVVDPDDDVDGDGFTVCGGDCNDFNAAVYPGAPEVCDGTDNDCDRARDEGFDEDGDNFTTCFGDCNDADPFINPFAREVPDDVDNNCNGDVDEGEEDADADAFSFLCGDCNDDNPNIGPQSPDVCDGIDNDCDGRVDRDPLGRSTCSVCNDVDEDGFEDCEGDCDDSDPAINPAAEEVCDGIDNDCDSLIDLDPDSRVNLCVQLDGGVPGLDAGGQMDGAIGRDAGPTDGSSADMGPATEPPVGQPDGIGPDDPLAVTCGCSTMEDAGDRTRKPGGGLGAESLLLALGLTALLLGRRRRGLGVALCVAGAVSCSDARVGDDSFLTLRDGGHGGPADGSDGSLSLPDGSDRAPDGGAASDGGPGGIDQGPGPDLGPLNEGPCRLADPGQVSEPVDFPGAPFRIALHRELQVRALDGVEALSLDAPELGLHGFVLGVPLDPVFDPTSFSVASEVIDSRIDPLWSRGLPGVTGVADQVDESLGQTFSLRARPASRTLRQVRMVNDVLPSRVRNGLLAELARVGLEEVGGLPAVPDETPTRSLRFAASTLVDPEEQRIAFVVLLADASVGEVGQRIMADLTNGSHTGDVGSFVEIACEEETALPLQVDFIWVVDNSASMQEEQQALSDTAGTFFQALDNSQIDYRLGVVSTDGEALRGGGFTRRVSDFRERVLVGVNGEGNEAGLEFAVRSLERARTASVAEQRLRDDAVPVVVFFSDEDSTNFRSIDAYSQALADLGALPFAIVGPRPRGCVAVGRGQARVGESYIRVVESLGGTVASICALDLSNSIEEILVASAGSASQILVDQQPISGSIEVQLSDRTVPRGRRNGFDYEPTANSLLFFGSANLPEGTPFRLGYQRFSRIVN